MVRSHRKPQISGYPKGSKGCAFCGSRNATTRDHVPPKGVFVQPLPANLITVPACKRCNTGSSATDERFRVMLSLRVGADKAPLAALWGGSILRGIKRNRRFHKELLRSAKEVEVRTPGGLYLGKRYLIPWDARSHDQTVTKITRGLYFHHFGEVIPATTRIKPYYFRQLDRRMAEIFRELVKVNIGDGQFRYAYGRAVDSPYVSCWFYCFHDSHLAGAFTAPEGLDEMIDLFAATASPVVSN